jgi:glyoxylase-like metal-dependent hydrolase (beta-lactamase superfamily II)
MIRLVYSAPELPAALQGLRIFERGWLSANNVLLLGEQDHPGAALIDTGHASHVDQTVALVKQGLQGQSLRCVVNTHLHSDHCGGNAGLQRAFSAPVFIPPGGFEAVRVWDAGALSYRATGQTCERFEVHGSLRPGESFLWGERRWDILAAPGHDPDAIMLFDAAHGVLISGDALWENGFGVVFPELDGDHAFDDVAAVLQQIETLNVQWVIPGHGAPFADVSSALARAHSRLARFRESPADHALHAAKVLLKFHLLEVQGQSLSALHLWVGDTPLMRSIWISLGRPFASIHLWCDFLVKTLVDRGVLLHLDGAVSNPPSDA